MIDGIIRWSLEHRLVVVALALGLLVWGAFETSRAPVDVFPDLTAPTVTVIAEAHGMAPEEVEALLTLPVESALNGVAGVRRVRSSTSVGVAVISVDFAWGTDIHRARQVVAERLQVVTPMLPEGVEPPSMGPVTSIMGEVLFVGLVSDEHGPLELRTVADRVVTRRLLAVPGIAQVIPMGGDARQYQVLLDPKKLDAFEVTADQVAHALEAANESTSAGFLVEAGQEYLIHGAGRIQSAEDVGQTLVTMRGDLPVRVQDVARVSIGPALARGDGGVNGRVGVVIGIRKQPGINTLDLTRRVDDVLDSLEASLPRGMKLQRDLFRQADFIQLAVDNVKSALRDGALLVIFIVLLFLTSVRATFITAIAIPLSLLTAVLAMAAQGMELNTMSLGGMAIAVGALVDDAIIDVENVVRRLRLEAARPEPERRAPLVVVFEASREIRRSIVFATLVIVTVFAPVFFLSSVEGRLLQPLGFAYVVSLSASLVVALTVTPALCLLLLPGSPEIRRPGAQRLVSWLHRAYEPVLRRSMRRWRLLAGASFVSLVVAAAALVFTGRSFLPPFDEGGLTVSVTTLPGTSLEESVRIGQQVEHLMLAHDEVVSTARRTGRAERDEHAQPVSVSEIEARLRLNGRSKEAFLLALRRDFGTVSGASIVVGQPIEHRIDHMLSGARANVAVKVFGSDLGELRRVAESVKRQIGAVPGAVDVTVEQQADVPSVTVAFRRGAIARHGLTIEAVAHEIETAFQGRTVTRVLEKQGVVDLVVRYDRSTADSFDALREVRLGTPSGARIPLHVLADVRRDVGPSVISRENVERKIVVMCNVSGRDLQSVVDDIRRRVSESVRDEGHRIEYGGQFESAQRATRTLLVVGGATVLVVFALLYVALRSARDAVLVMVNLPLALVGGVVGLHASGGVVSVASLIGFVTLFGVATRNGIMMVTHFHHLREQEGVTDPDELVARGAAERLAPILMTALASGLGLLPLALRGGEAGNEIQAPMATVILFGLVTATALNMIVLPALYRRFGARVAV